MNKSKIDWCDYTWNPVGGCLNQCTYCYARKIAHRFAARDKKGDKPSCTGTLHEIKYTNIPYPFGFDPTFHKYRLDEPQKIKTPQRIFVCSMADLFGDWVPESWIQQVFEACEKAAQHEYLFLTKNPRKLVDHALFHRFNENQNWMIGTTITDNAARVETLLDNTSMRTRLFISIEPLLGAIPELPLKSGGIKWVIVGQQSNPTVIPHDSWVENIISQCRENKIPVFVKEPLFKKFPIQEYPEKENNNGNK